MKISYPVVICAKEAGEKYHAVFVPDLDCATQGKNIADALAMAQDLIGIVGLRHEDQAELHPESTPLSDVKLTHANDIVKLVTVDLVEYRTKRDKDQRSFATRIRNAWTNLQWHWQNSPAHTPDVSSATLRLSQA